MNLPSALKSTSFDKGKKEDKNKEKQQNNSIQYIFSK